MFGSSCFKNYHLATFCKKSLFSRGPKLPAHIRVCRLDRMFQRQPLQLFRQSVVQALVPPQRGNGVELPSQGRRRRRWKSRRSRKTKQQKGAGEKNRRKKQKEGAEAAAGAKAEAATEAAEAAAAAEAADARLSRARCLKY